MRVFWESTTAQFGIFVLTVAALSAGFGDLKWSEWFTGAITVLGIYAGKEGIKYGATAYKEKA